VKGSEEIRDAIVAAINKRGAPCFQGGCSEVYLERAFENTKFVPETRLPVARKLGDRSLMFLCHPSLTQQEVNITCDIISDVCAKFSNV
jgi:dTDP-4-amino-4,6-dideoxygalactose transaminase